MNETDPVEAIIKSKTLKDKNIDRVELD